MTSHFIASNGFQIDADRGIILNEAGILISSNTISSRTGQAILEFGRHLERTQRDAELGLLRSSQHPDLVMRAINGDNDRVEVYDERTGNLGAYRRGRMPVGGLGESPLNVAAREFFAHTEPPWMRPNEGEIWVFKARGVPQELPFVYRRRSNQPSQSCWHNMDGVPLPYPVPWGDEVDPEHTPYRLWPKGEVPSD